MFRENISKEALAHLPLRVFEGEILVVDDDSKVFEAVEYLSACTVIGFDTETKPSFKRGQVNPVALLQLSSADRAYLFRLQKIGLPQELIYLLSDPNIQKVGVAIHDDIKTLQRLEYFQPKGFVELQDEVKDFGIQD